MPIINHANELVGIVSLGDVAVKSTDKRTTVEALEQISQPAALNEKACKNSSIDVHEFHDCHHIPHRLGGTASTEQLRTMKRLPIHKNILNAYNGLCMVAMSAFKQHVITVLMIWSSVLAGCAQHDQYIPAALEHADQAMTNGQRRDNNALAEQATVALRYIYLAERNNNKDGRVQDAILLLKEGINHARYGRSNAGVQAVKNAYKLLAEVE